MASTGASCSSWREIGARLFASRANHRRENYVVRGYPRNSVAPSRVLLPPSRPSRTSDRPARALQVVSIVCRSIEYYLRARTEAGECARARCVAGHLPPPLLHGRWDGPVPD